MLNHGVGVHSADPPIRKNYATEQDYLYACKIKKEYDIVTTVIHNINQKYRQWLEERIKNTLRAIRLLSTGLIFNTEIKTQRELTKFYVALSKDYTSAHQLDAAKQSLSLAIKSDPTYAPAYSALGLLYEKIQDYYSAEKAYLDTIALDPLYGPAYINLGVLYAEAYQKTKNISLAYQAIDEFEKAKSIELVAAAAYRNQAEVYQQLRLFDFAYECLHKALQLAPNEALTCIAMADFSLFQGSLASAEQWYMKGLTYSADDHGAAIYSYTHLGFIYLAQRKYIEAEAWLNQAYLLNNKQSNVILSLISINFILQNFTKTIDYIDNALNVKDTLMPKYYSYIYEKLAVTFLQLNYLEEAKLAYKAAIKFQTVPTFLGAEYMYLGNVQFDLGEYQEAINSYVKAQCLNHSLNLQASIQEAQGLLVSHSARPPQQRSRLNLQDYTQFEQEIINSLLPANYAAQIKNLAQGHVSISGNKVIYQPILDEVPMSSKKFFLKCKNGIYYKKSMHPQANWKLANSDKLNNFVVIFDNETRRHVVIFGHTGHYYLAKGQTVRFAGGVLFRDGKIIHWNNKSGHYKPFADQASKEIAPIIGFPIEKFVSYDILHQRIKQIAYKLVNQRKAAVALRDLITHKKTLDLHQLSYNERRITKSFLREFS